MKTARKEANQQLSHALIFECSQFTVHNPPGFENRTISRLISPTTGKTTGTQIHPDTVNFEICSKPTFVPKSLEIIAF